MLETLLQPFILYYLAGFLITIFLGAILQHTQFCTMGAFANYFTMGDTRQLRIWFIAVAWCIAAVAIGEYFNWINLNGVKPNYRSSEFAWGKYLLGGLLFGIGMTIAGGCTSRNIIRLSAGNFRALITLGFAGFAAWLMNYTTVYSEYFSPWLESWVIDTKQYQLATQTLPVLITGLIKQPLSSFLMMCLSIGFAFTLWIVMRFVGSSIDKDREAKWLIFGLAFSVIAIWWVTGGSLGASAYEASQFVTIPPQGLHPQGMNTLSPLMETGWWLYSRFEPFNFSFGITMVLGLLFGGWLWAILTKKWRFEWFIHWQEFIQHAFSGFLMGIGGSLALGCTFGQGFAGLSLLSLGSVLAIVSISVGCWFTLKCLYRWL